MNKKEIMHLIIREMTSTSFQSEKDDRTIIRTLISISGNLSQDVEEIKEWCTENHIDSTPLSQHKLVNHILNIG